MYIFQNVLDTGARRRSNAFGEKDGPKLRRHSSSRDIYIKKQILVEIPYSILRGNGFSSYYVYEVKVGDSRVATNWGVASINCMLCVVK